MSVYESAVRPLLFRLDAERAHNLALRASELGRALVARPACGRARVHLPRPAAGDVARRAPAREPARARRRVRQERARDRDARRARASGTWRSARSPRTRPTATRSRGCSGSRRTTASSSPTASPTTARTWCASGSPAPRRVPLGVNLVKTNDPARPGRRARGLRGLRRLVRRAAGPRGLRRAEHELPELGRRSRLLRRPAARRRAARPARRRATRACRCSSSSSRRATPGVLREIVAIADGHPFVSGFAINLPSGKPRRPRADRRRGRRWSGCRARSAGRRSRSYVNAILGTLRSIVGDGAATR